MKRFINGDGLLNTTLFLWVFFLAHTYTRILWHVNPNRHAIDSAFNVVESIAFGFATFLVIRRSNSIAPKIIFSVFEGIAVWFYYGGFGVEYLTLYIAILCGCSVFALGYISILSQKQKDREEATKVTNDNELVTSLKNEVTRKNDEVTKLKNEVTRKNDEVTNLENEVTKLNDIVTSMGMDSNITKTTLLSTIEFLKSEKDAVYNQLNELKQKSVEWEREYIKSQISNIKRDGRWNEKDEKVNAIIELENKLRTL